MSIGLVIDIYFKFNLRFSVNEYSTDETQLENSFVHLVNNSIGKESEDFHKVLSVSLDDKAPSSDSNTPITTSRNDTHVDECESMNPVKNIDGIEIEKEEKKSAGNNENNNDDESNKMDIRSEDIIYVDSDQSQGTRKLIEGYMWSFDDFKEYIRSSNPEKRDLVKEVIQPRLKVIHLISVCRIVKCMRNVSLCY